MIVIESGANTASPSPDSAASPTNLPLAYIISVVIGLSVILIALIATRKNRYLSLL